SGERHDIEAFVAQLLRLVGRGLAPDTALRRFFVVDLARLLGESPADVLGPGDELADELQHLGVAAQRHFGRLLGLPFDALLHGRRRAADAYLRGRPPLDRRIVADGAPDHRALALPPQVLRRP